VQKLGVLGHDSRTVRPKVADHPLIGRGSPARLLAAHPAMVLSAFVPMSS
jgi:hypothetical protein